MVIFHSYVNVYQRVSYIANWLVVSTPLKNVKVSWDDEIPNIWKNKYHVPNHQPVYIYMHIYIYIYIHIYISIVSPYCGWQKKHLLFREFTIPVMMSHECPSCGFLWGCPFFLVGLQKPVLLEDLSETLVMLVLNQLSKLLPSDKLT